MMLSSILLMYSSVQNIIYTDKQFVWILILGLTVALGSLMCLTFFNIIKKGYNRNSHYNFLILAFTYALFPFLAMVRLIFALAAGISSGWNELDVNSLSLFALMAFIVILFFLNIPKPKEN